MPTRSPFVRASLAALAVATVLAGCARERTAELPSAPGLYAFDAGTLTRLESAPAATPAAMFESPADLTPDARFLVVDADADGPRDVGLRQIVRLRHAIGADGRVQPATPGGWLATGLAEFGEALELTPADRAGAVWATPAAPLHAGLYELRHDGAGGAERAWFSVERDRIDLQDYAQTHCVDRVEGPAPGLRSCTEPLVLAALEVRDLHARRDTVSGLPGLVVEGVVANPSSLDRTLPPLRARLFDAQGREALSWTFTADAATLPAGGEVRFRTSTVQPPPGVVDVQVSVAEEDAG